MKYEDINLCTVWKFKYEHWAFDLRKDAETMVKLIKWLCEEVEILKEENKNISIKLESLLLLDKISWKDK